jgi:CRP-like cAMP-binding protein
MRALGASGSKKAFPVLQAVIDGGKKNFGRKSVDAAEIAISLIREQKNRERKSKQKPRMKRGVPVIVSPEANPESPSIIREYELITRYPEEKEAYKLLQQDKKKAATQMLLQLIDKTAYLKQFNDAELLRMRLIEVDPMALSNIVKAADFIEEAKGDSIDQDHILIWSDLYDLLSTEEFNVFYHALKHETYTSEETIVKQGDPQWLLCFVNKGRVKLCYNEHDNQTLVKTLGRGNVFGGTSFFDESVWTLSAITMGAVELSTLSMDSVEEWGEVYPALEAKLQVYCQRFDRVNEFFISSGADRRAMERVPLTGTVHLMLLDDNGSRTDTSIHGACSDISIGGFSFVSNISNRKQARTLLGRQVEFSIENDETSGKSIQLTGTVVAVRKRHSVEIGRSVHIQFDSLPELNGIHT